MPLAKPTKPDAITAVPTPVPLRTDRANFAARGDAMMGWFPTGIAGVNTTLTYFGNAVNFAEQEANEAEASATAAAASNAAAAVNAAAAAASAGATVWVTGTTYAAGVVKYSPTNFQTYRDTAGGVSSTDPASDTTGRWISAMLPSAEAIGLPAMSPTAVFNFASGVIDRRFVESRSTAGTRYNIFGNLETLAAGVAKPTFNPLTRACEGYLASPAATYMGIDSEDFAGWGASDTGGGFGAAVAAPDGTLTAKSWTVPTSTFQFGFGQKIKYGGIDASGQAVFEVWVRRPAGSGVIALGISDISAVSNAGANEAVGTTWRKLSFTSTTLTNTGNIGAAFNATPGEVFELWHPTLVLGTNANQPYYPTTSSSFPRDADRLALDLTAHTAVINPNGFTLVIALDGTTVPNSGVALMLTGVGTDEIYLIRIGANWTCYGKASGVLDVQTSVGAFVAGPTVIALSFSTAGCLGLVRGGSVVSLGTFAVMPVMESLIVGAYESSGYELNSHVKLIATFPRACTAGELTAFVNNF